MWTILIMPPTATWRRPNRTPSDNPEHIKNMFKNRISRSRNVAIEPLEWAGNAVPVKMFKNIQTVPTLGTTAVPLHVMERAISTQFVRKRKVKGRRTKPEEKSEHQKLLEAALPTHAGAGGITTAAAPVVKKRRLTADRSIATQFDVPSGGRARRKPTTAAI